MQKGKNRGNNTPSKMFPKFLMDMSKVYPGYGIMGIKPKHYGNISEEIKSEKLS